MNYYEQIFTIATFALYSFIFSLFMLPIIRNLKEIQQKIRNKIKPRSLTTDPNSLQAKEEIKKQRKEFVEIIEEYKLEYKGIYDLKKCLIYGGIITTLATILIFLFNINCDQAITFTILILFLIWMAALVNYALNTYIPAPYKITEWAYMKEYFNLSPSGIAECADLKVDYNPKDYSIFSSFDPTTKRSIKIFSDIELRGYKYWIFLYDSKNKMIISNLIGSINKTTALVERLPDTAHKGWYVNISEFDAYKYKDNKEVKIFFFVFDPITFGDEGCPYWGYKNFETDEQIRFSSANTLVPQGIFYNIKYKGKNLNFKELQWQAQPPPQDKDKEAFKIIKEAFEISKSDLQS